MTSEFTVVEKDWIARDVRCLKPRCHLPCMKWIAVFIRITGYEHCGGVGYAQANPVIRGVVCERRKVVRFVCRSEFISPDVRIVKEMITEHVQQRNHAYNCPEKVWPLGQGCSNEQAGIRPSKNGEFVLCGSTALDQPFCGAQKIVVSSLAVTPLGSIVPFRTEFRATSDIWQGKHASMFHQIGYEDAKLRHHGDAISPVGGHDHGASATFQNIFAPH